MAGEGHAARCAARKSFGHKNTILLQALLHATPEQRRAILRHANKDLIRCISECCLNILRGSVPLKKSQKSSLSIYKSVLRKLTEKNSSLPTKKKMIVQKGGAFLPLLLGPIIGALASHLF